VSNAVGASGGGDNQSALEQDAVTPARKPIWAKPGTVIGGRFIVEGLLGSGGMGCVVLARHRELGELRAIKLLRPERAPSDEARRRLVSEARAASTS
jgi:serine/threonine protein kinase